MSYGVGENEAASRALCSFSVVALLLCGQVSAQAENSCAGGKFKVTNTQCAGVLYVLVCNGADGKNGHSKASLQRTQSASFDTPAGSTYNAICGHAPQEKCDATWCVDGRDKEH